MLNKLEKRIIDISYKNKLSHLGSCLGSVNLIDKTYEEMKKDDIFVLGNSHAALALYVNLEKHRGQDAEKLVEKHGTHASRDKEAGIFVSGGSLGQAETVAVGLAIANSDKTVYLITSDGACAEGSVWEALRVARDLRVENMRIAVVANGYGGYGKIDVDDLDMRLNAFYPVLVVKSSLFHLPSWIQGNAGHYVVMDKEKYEEIIK